jgi:hypothetical protein
MGQRVTWAAGLAAVLLGVAGATAHAESVAPARAANSFAAGEASPWTLTAPRKSLQWDSKGRWGVRLDMDKPYNRDVNWTDVQAGAFFRVTPSLRIGGTVGVAPPATPHKLVPQDPGARVHVETKFQF